MNNRSVIRLRYISGFILLVALSFVFKLYTLQVMRHDDYSRLANKQYLKNDGGIFSRGTIYFKNKDGGLISAGTLQSGYLLSMNPRLVKDNDRTYTALSSVLKLDHDTFLQKAEKDDAYEELVRKVSEEDAEKIKNMKLPGIALHAMQWRFYPGGATASHELGFLGYDSKDNFGGRYGLERYYEDTLKRTENEAYANFFIQIFSNIKSITGTESSEGDIVASIEPSVQTALEDNLKQIQNKWSAEEVGGIIMDPMTGEIYGMASLPSFDPNDFKNIKNASTFSSPLVENVREMGSIVKTLTLAAGLDANVITASSTYEDKGFMIVNTEKIWNHDHTINGHTTMQEVLDKSLNMGAAYVEGKLGNKLFAKYMEGYGLMDKTGIDLPNEAQNIVTNLKSPRDVEYVTASFGQGIAMTPVSMIRAIAVLANGGLLVTPHLITKINYGGGFSKSTLLPENKRVISSDASKKISKMLVFVVDNALLGGKIKNPHYSIAAKTGTAQIANPNGGGYYNDRFLHSFMGYFPTNEPKFVILLYVLDPQTSLFAADTLAMPFSDLSKFLINYYQIAPDR